MLNWEQVAEGTCRLPVEGGWLYSVTEYNWDDEGGRGDVAGVAVTFVPDATRRVELLDAAQGVVDVCGDFMQRIAEESDLHEAVNALQQALGDCR